MILTEHRRSRGPRALAPRGGPPTGAAPLALALAALLGAPACDGDQPASLQAPGPSAQAPGARGDAQAQASCDNTQALDPYALLRRLSLDLRGRLPSLEEYEALDGLSEVPAATIDAMMADDGYRLSMRRLHEDLLWTNPTGAELMDGNTRILSSRAQIDGQSALIYAIQGAARRNLWRGDPSVICAPRLQEDFENGVPVAQEVLGDEGQLLYRQEGYVPVHPYWAPDETVYMCAFDAQEAAVSPRGEACDTVNAFREVGCGCGPGLKWCYGPDVQEQVWADMREQVARAVDRVTVGGAPYTELLTSPAAEMNGSLAFWKLNLAQMVGLGRTYNAVGVGDPDIPPDVDFTDPSWQTYERGDLHAGITTMPAFTLRFQTSRAKANRFRIAFTGQYFVPPTQPEDPATAACEAVSGDLTQMCTCRGCHQVLEPLAAHYAQVIEAGSTLVSDFPAYEQACDPNLREGGSVPRSCARLYAVETTDKNPGWRLTHQYAWIDDPGFDSEGLDDALHRSIAAHIDSGPGGLAAAVIGSGQLASATVKNVFSHLVGRPMILDPADDRSELALLTELSAAFEASWDFQALTRAVVDLPQYRRIR